MALFKKKDKVKEKYAFSNYPHLVALKPKEKYVFHSDYILIDNQYQTIMSFFHNDGAKDSFPPFWGINRIPSGLDKDIVVIILEQVRRMTDGWLSDHQSKSEGIAETGSNEQGRGGNNTGKAKSAMATDDLQIISEELLGGASYLNVQDRIIVKAPTLEKLDRAVEIIARLYVDRFSTLRAAPYPGEQRSELTNLFRSNKMKKGKGFYFTSSEFAGSHFLVTNGLSDNTGEYVGVMHGDVNNSAVLLDVNNYKHHIVIANEAKNERLGNSAVADVWGSKISQSCMLNNGRVVHIILNDCNLDKLGPLFDNISYKLDMNSGDVNMFEMFGDIENELAVFPIQMQKLRLMALQAYEATDSDRGAILGSLEELATRFYIDNRMWYKNAIANKDKLRIIGLPHNEYPKLEDFCAYLDVAYKALANKVARDDEKLHAISALNYTFKNMLANNGDLFNTITSSSIDGVREGIRVVYDFSRLTQRGLGIAMAQLVNVIGFAVSSLGKGDTLIIHGTEIIDNGIKPFLEQQFNAMYRNDARICFLYNDIEKMIDDKGFNRFDKADYTIYGAMTQTILDKYEKSLGHPIPPDLQRLIINKSTTTNYIRRDFDNVIFEMDLLLNIPKKKTDKRGYRSGRNF